MNKHLNYLINKVYKDKPNNMSSISSCKPLFTSEETKQIKQQLVKEFKEAPENKLLIEQLEAKITKALANFFQSPTWRTRDSFSELTNMYRGLVENEVDPKWDAIYREREEKHFPKDTNSNDLVYSDTQSIGKY